MQTRGEDVAVRVWGFGLSSDTSGGNKQQIDKTRQTTTRIAASGYNVQRRAGGDKTQRTLRFLASVRSCPACTFQEGEREKQEEGARACAVAHENPKATYNTHTLSTPNPDQ